MPKKVYVNKEDIIEEVPLALENEDADLPEEVGDYPPEDFLAALKEAGWNHASHLPHLKGLIRIIEKTEDTETAELIMVDGSRDRTGIINSIVSTVEDIGMEEICSAYPEEMAFILYNWNKSHPEDPQKSFEGMEKYTDILRAEEEQILAEERLLLERREAEKQEAERLSKEKAAWIEKAERAGWDMAGDKEFLSILYDARYNKDGSINDNLVKLLNGNEFTGTVSFANRIKVLLTIKNSLERQIKYGFGNKEENISDAQRKAFDEVKKEYAACRFLGNFNAVKSLDGIKTDIKNPSLAEVKVIGDFLFGKRPGELAEICREKGISPGSLVLSIKKRLDPALEKAGRGPGMSEDLRRIIRDIKEYTNVGIDEIRIPAEPGEAARIGKAADEYVESFISEGLKAFNSLDRDFYENYEREREEYLSSAERAGWNEENYGDRSFFEGLFDTRYDKNGDVIEKIDKAIKDFAFDKNDLSSRRRKKEEYADAVESIPEEERTFLQERYLDAGRGRLDENCLRSREEYVDKVMEYNWGMTRDDARAVYDYFSKCDGFSDLLRRKIAKGISEEYPNWRVNNESPIVHLQRNTLFKLMLEKEKGIQPSEALKKRREKALNVLQRLISENEAAAEKERQEIKQHEEEFEKKKAGELESIKDNILSLTDEDLSKMAGMSLSGLNSSRADGLSLFQLEIINMKASLKEAKADFNSEKAKPIKDAIYTLRRAAGNLLPKVDKHISEVTLKYLKLANPDAAKEYEDRMAVKDRENARKEEEVRRRLLEETRKLQEENRRKQEEKRKKLENDVLSLKAEKERHIPELTVNALNAAESRKTLRDSLITILNNLERTDNLHFFRDNSQKYEDMKRSIAELRDNASVYDSAKFDSMVNVVKNRMFDYLEDTGYHSAWRKKGNLRKECAIAGIYLINPTLGAEVIKNTNDARWRKNHVTIEGLLSKPGVGLAAGAEVKKVELDDLKKSNKNKKVKSGKPEFRRATGEDFRRLQKEGKNEPDLNDTMDNIIEK